jgi:glycosyltransferase involved in cell wall biosynthesis
MIEAMASGTPVAARVPVLDVVRDGESGVLGDDLRTAALAALDLDRARSPPRSRFHGNARQRSS